MKQKKIIILILLLTIICIVIKNNNRDNFYYLKENNLYYKDHKINNKFPANNIVISKDRNKALYTENNILYIYDKNKSTKIKKDIIDYQFTNNKDYIVIDKNNNLFIKDNLITKKINKILYTTNNFIIYDKNNKLYSYNIHNKKISSIGKNNNIRLSDDENNLIIFDSNFKLYNLKRNKVINKKEKISNYYCLNSSCTKYYYIKNNILHTIKDKKLQKNILENNVITNNENEIIYVNIEKDNYNIYHQKGNNDSKKVLSSKQQYNKLKVLDNKIYYITKEKLKSINFNGKSKKTITNQTTDIIDIYNGKVLLMKHNDLYLENQLIKENITKESIKIINNKIFFLTGKNNIYNLYESTGKKANLITKNVNKYWEIDNKVYYLGDYNISRKYGNLYKYPNKKILVKRIENLFY